MSSLFLLISLLLICSDVGRVFSQQAEEALQNESKDENLAIGLSPLGCDCNSGGLSGVSTNFPLKNCKSACNVAYQGDCLCNKDYHPTGCTLKDCTEADGDVISLYSCYCTPTYAPYNCVARPNNANPLCTVDGDADVPADCQCDSEDHDADNCTIRECNPKELIGDGYRCICGDSCDQKPDGCVKISFEDNVVSSVQDILGAADISL
ncbi:unnamed protein product [Orchesella dallaii]|uniref:Uncharacterized protein n=1 Tax=Orchesella dallaii TaxID=48710 RepID=A0ABP1RVR1_9HEXA